MKSLIFAFLLSTAPAMAQSVVPDLRAAQQTLSRTAPACAVAAAPQDERLILAGASTPTVISDLVLADRDNEAQAVTLNIEPGPDGIYLAIAADDGVLYVVNDPSGRIRQLQLLTSGAVAGTAGWPPERVQIVDMSKCAGADLSRHLADAALAGNRQSAARIGSMFGRLPELVALRDARAVALPSGSLDRPTVENNVIIYSQRQKATTRTVYVVSSDGKATRMPSTISSDVEIDPDLMIELDNEPGGVRVIDPATVVSPSGVKRSARMAAFRR